MAKWGLAVQEFDLQIQHQPGKHNANAAVLSHFPLSAAVDSRPHNVVAAVIGTSALPGWGKHQEGQRQPTLSAEETTQPASEAYIS